jgi:hypothetical protein
MIGKVLTVASNEYVMAEIEAWATADPNLELHAMTALEREGERRTIVYGLFKSRIQVRELPGMPGVPVSSEVIARESPDAAYARTMKLENALDDAARAHQEVGALSSVLLACASHALDPSGTDFAKIALIKGELDRCIDRIAEGAIVVNMAKLLGTSAGVPDETREG